MNSKRYDIIERHGDNDVSIWTVELPNNFFDSVRNEGSSERTSVSEMVAKIVSDQYFVRTNDEILLQKFYKHFESCWDYTYQIFDRGLTLGQYISDMRPEFSNMFKKSKPAHISVIPAEVRAGYIMYLRNLLAEHWGVRVDDLEYDDIDAAREFCADTEEEN